jgi:hypothetical protein
LTFITSVILYIVEIGEGGKWFVMLANWCLSAVGLNCNFV